MKAPLPPTEQARLEALRRYKILDTNPEAAFDDIAHLAAQLCETPMAVISFVDEHRQWFKSRVCVGFSETTRDVAFCAHALLEPDILIVPDTLEDPRFADNPLVTGEPYQRFYAGALLRGVDNEALGTLCVMDTRPRELTTAQISGLQALARQIVAQLNLRLSQTTLLAELAHQESARNNLISTLPGIVYQCRNEPDWPMEFISGRVLEISGYTADEFLSHTVTWGDLIHADDQEPTWQVVQEALATKQSFQIEYRIRDKDGREKQIWEQGLGLYNAQGELVILEGFISDITNQATTAQALARQNDILRMLNTVSQEVSSTLDVPTILQKMVEAYTKLLGGTSGYFSDWNMAQGTSTVLAEYYSPEASAEERVSDLGHSYPVQEYFNHPPDWPLQIKGYVIHHAEGNETPAADRHHLLEYGIKSVLTIPLIINEEPVGIFELYESRYQREFEPAEIDLFQTLINQAVIAIENARLYERTQQSQQRNRALIEQSPLAVIQWDMNFCVAEWNSAAEQIFGYTRQEALGQHAKFILEESVWPMVDDIWQHLKTLTGGERSVNKNITADGRTITCDWHNITLQNTQGEPIGVISNVNNISDVVEAEERLRYQAQILEQVTEAIISVDFQFIIRSWNKSAERMYGYTAEETIGHHIGDFLETEYLNYAPGEGTKILLSTGQFSDRAIQRTKNGRELLVDTYPTLLRDESGTPTGIAAVNRDITAQQQAEKERIRLISLLENTSDFVGIAGADGSGIFINNAGRTLLGIPETVPTAELTTLQIFPHLVFKQLQTEIIPHVLQHGLWSGESALRHWTTNHEIPVSQVILAEKDSTGRLVSLSTIARDLTEQKAAEASLLQRQEMLRRQQQASLRLTQSDTINKKGLQAALEEITQITTEVFDVARASIWTYDPSGPRIQCLDLYERDTQEHQQGAELYYNQAPAYFEAILTERAIVADDAHTNLHTRELSDFYLQPLGINSMLDAFIRVGDEIRGVVCLEHIGPARTWTLEEQSFAGSLADLTTLAMEADERLHLQEQMNQSLARRSRQVQITTQIAQEIASAGEIFELYQRVVDLTKEEFGYYHVQLLQYNPALDAVALIYGYGRVGQQMLELGHTMPMGVGIIGQAALHGHSVLSSDVRQNPNWRPQPLLPETRGELAVPIKFGNQTLGVLDIQSDQVDSLTQEDTILLEGLCGQIGTAIESTRLRQDMEERLNELNNLQRLISREAWQSFLSSFEGQPTGYLYDHQTIQPLNIGNGGSSSGQGTGRLSLPDLGERPYIMPLAIRGENIGTVGIQDSAEAPLTAEEHELLTAIFTQISEALENARLLEQTQKRAVEMETVAQVSTATSSILEVQQMLQAVVDLTKGSFGLYHAHIYLYTKEQKELELVAGAGEVGSIMVAEGWHIPLYQQQSLVARAARSRRGLIITDTRKEPDYLPNPLLPETRSEMIVPMIVGDTLVGVLDLQSNRPNAFTDDDLRIQTTLSTQVAIAVQNARLYQEQIETAEKLRDVDKLKSQFLASMSHELRTPLNSIIGFADVLLEGIDGELNERMEEDVQLIREGGQHLRALIGDILDMAKIEAGRMDLSYGMVDLDRVAHEVMAATSGLIKDKPINLKLTKEEDGFIIEADRTRLVQVLLNLLSNAAKFTDKGDIELSFKRQDEEHLVIGVRDSGIGIKPEDASQVFEQFRQIGGLENRKAGGTGLGMPITKQLVELHGGRIWLESVYGEGTTFFVLLPIKKPEGRQQASDGYYA